VALPFAGVGHALPQVRQLAGSVVVSTHEPEQFVAPPVQLSPQTPSVHTSFAPHVFPHSPQLNGSVPVNTQALPQRAPWTHTKSQVLLLQTGAAYAGALHCVGHPPQWSGSVVVSTHAEPHAVSAPSQLKPHTPLAQVGCALLGARHFVWQLPQ
jgi:hypothetical protein